MTPKDAASWMVEQLKELHYLDQSYVVSHLLVEAEDLLYLNNDGSWAVGKPVLAEFRKLTPDAVWSRSALHWRFREAYDQPGRMQP